MMQRALPVALVLLAQLAPSLCTSTLEFFQSDNCGGSLGTVNGSTDGVCHQAIANNDGARVVELDQGCAATIYTDPFCSDDATIAALNICMSGNLIVGSFSIDCQATQSSAPAFTANGPTPTASSQSAFSASSDSSAGSSGPSIPQAAVIAAVAGASVVAVSLLPICYFARRRYKKKKAARAALADDLKHSQISSPTELAASEKPESIYKAWGMPVPQIAIPKSSPSQRSVPMVSPLTPAPLLLQTRYEHQQQLTPGWKPLQSASPTTPTGQWYRDKTLPATPGPQRPGSFAELATSEPSPQRSMSGASTASGGSPGFGSSYGSSRTLRNGGFF